ncbi:TonB-dependent receptor [Desertivirga arenae]|uniref:TonB-dependent receptor n=1 Tax=Desertivirga arenae TaxID=2810309 RepID=UPI001F615EB0|nr:TonB-dependent receptor [Pedobacter sp. SYSU D00823]
MLASLMQVSASGLAQSISLSTRNESLRAVLKEIGEQTKFNFVYRDGLLDAAEPVTIKLRNIPMESALKLVLKGQGIDFEMSGKTVVLKEKEEPSIIDMAAAAFRRMDVKGLVLDERDQPLAGATIKVKGGTVGTVSSREGRFTIVVPDENSVLIISFIGYENLEVPVRSSLTVHLKPELNKLNNIVVVGYGSAKRKDLTGSVASVDLNEVKDVPFATVDQAITGKAAGVQVVQSDGSPGGVAKIRIRGGTSLLGGNDPLYVIDGVQVQVQNQYQKAAADLVSPTERIGQDNYNSSVSGSFARGLNSLGGLNINDIESIDILKDASATAIYGSRAANGVVIITTKKGKTNQKPVLEANYYTGLSIAEKERVLNRDQFIMILKEGASNLNNERAARNLAPNALATQILTDATFFGSVTTDWMNLVTRQGQFNNVDLSLRGGGAGSRYYTSLAYNTTEGTVAGTDFQRIAGKVSLENDINTRLRFHTNLDYGFTTNDITNGLYTQAIFAPPTLDPYNPDGSLKNYDLTALNSYAYQGFQNPLLLTKGVNKASNIFLLGSLAGEYDILKDLKFRSSIAVNFSNYRQNNYVPSTVGIATSNGMGSSNNGTASQAENQQVNTFVENTLTWNKQFNDNHRLNFLLGTSWQITKTNSFSASGQGFPDDTYLNNLSSAAVTLPSTGLSGQNSLLSFYARANYSLKDKYLFTFTGRSDASSKFPEANRVGYFPSGGVAWRISQENFLKGVSWISDIKLRASAGYTGTQNIADNLFYTLYSPVSYAGLNGLSPTQLGNDRLKWESTLQKDAGVDFAFFNSRIRGGVGYYDKSTSGILFPTSVASSAGFSTVTANIAKIQNRGLELELTGEFVKTKPFQWSGTFTIAGNRSKVLTLSPQFEDPANPKVYRFGNTVLKVGQPVGLLYGRVFDKILQTQEEVNNYKKGLLSTPQFLGIGDASYVMEDNYSGISGVRYFKNDVIGNAEPRFYGGYTNRISYKSFSLTALATYSYGGDIFYLADVQNMDLASATNKGVRILDRWTPENAGSSRPRLLLGQSSFAYTASNSVYDASFIKLKSLTFGYQLPINIRQKLKLTGASAYVSATNLFTLTNYPGVDPETSNDPYSLIGGYSDSGGYPYVRQLSLGLRLGL